MVRASEKIVLVLVLLLVLPLPPPKSLHFHLTFIMRQHTRLRSFLLISAAFATLAASAFAKPKVVVVSMGGTIASVASSRMNLNNYGGKGNSIGPQRWLDDVPEVQEIATVTAEDMRQPEGTVGGDTLPYLYSVAKRLQELANDSSVDGIVVSHGTNTLAEAAWFMHLTVSVKKPLVFVGSQRPWSGISTDGHLNFYNAVQIAATPAAGGLGVVQMMNETLNGARDVTKTSAYRVETFKSPDTGPLGYADADKVVIYNKPLRRHTSASEFNISTLPPKLPEVEILYGYTESPGYLVDALVTHGVKGIIIDGTGAGSPAGGQIEALKKAQEKGIVVVATARTRAGRVQDTPRRREAKIVPGDNLPPEKARILLMLALTKTTDLAEIQRIFDQY
jgi:L-asparaginase